MEHFFSPISSGDLRSDAHQSQVIGGDADVDRTQIVGGIYPLHTPRFSAPPRKVHSSQLFRKIFEAHDAKAPALNSFNQLICLGIYSQHYTEKLYDKLYTVQTAYKYSKTS